MVRFLLAALACAFCCAPAVAQERKEVRIWIRETIDPGLLAALRQFERLNPGVRVVETPYVGGRGQDAQKLLTAVVGGSPPDVIMQDRFTVGEWAARGAFRPLDDFLAATGGALTAEQFYPTCWKEAVYEGKSYAVPFTTDTRALFYNEDLLIRAGFVDENGQARPPKDWDELRAYAPKLTTRTPNGRIAQLGFAPNYGDSWLYLYAWLNGGSFMTPDGRTVTLNEPRVVEALAYMRDLYALVGGAKLVDAFTQSAGNNVEFDPFGTDRLAMKIDGSWQLRFLGEHHPSVRYRVAPPPAPKGRDTTTWSGGLCYVIPATSKQPQLAFDLIRYLVSEEGWLIQADVNARYSASRGRAFIPDMTAQPRINELVLRQVVDHDPTVPQRAKDALRVFYGLMEKSNFRPVTPVGQVLWDEHVRAIGKVTLDGEEPKAALDRATAEVQRAVDAHFAQGAARRGTPANMPVMIGVILGSAALAIVAGFVVAWRMGRLRVRKDEAGAAALFLAPWAVGFLVLTAGPIAASLAFAFCRYSVLAPAEWVGLDNFRTLAFGDKMFWQSLLNTAYMLIGVPLGMAVGLGLALLLNTEVRGVRVYRTLFYLPAIVPVVASSVLWVWVLNPENGLINGLIGALGLDRVSPGVSAMLSRLGIDWPPLWLNSKSWVLGSKAAILLMGLWTAGAGMIVWLAGLKGIPEHLYEAARIDGAGPIGRFFNVTLPMLSPYVLFNLIVGTIGTVQIFAQAFIMTQGGPADSTMFYAYYLFNHAFRYFQMGYASALAWVLLVIVMLLTLLQLWWSKRWVHYTT